MLRVSEIYRSVQGEGPNVGKPTLFVRFGGCNLRCPGWACDTDHAINPKYRNEWERYTPEQLTYQIVLRSASSDTICFTGGEPFLQQHEALKELIVPLSVSRKLEAFTNGTLEIPEWVFKYVALIIDCKLQGSGETNFNANALRNNLHTAVEFYAKGMKKHALKFTVANEDDFREAVGYWVELVAETNGIGVPTFVAPVWGKVEPKDLVGWILDADLPWRLNLQMHKYIWPADERGV